MSTNHVPQIQHNAPLTHLNTFQVACTASAFATISSSEQIQALIATGTFAEYDTHLILGGGSNILLTTDHFNGLAIKNEILGKEIINHTDSTVTIRVGAGENRDQFVTWTLDQGYYGIENLISIPGAVGASPIQNIGAYGLEVGERIHSVEYIDLTTGELHTLCHHDCQFGYRDSIFKHVLKNKVIITHVTFTLSIYTPDTYAPNISYGAIIDTLDTDTPNPSDIAHAIATIRAGKLPDWKHIGTAGSFFKNPILSTDSANQILNLHPNLVTYPAGTSHLKFSAGQLIDLAGLKGMTHGNAGTYKNHALILINTGGATGQEIRTCAQMIIEKVKDMFGITLHPEVNIIQ